MKILHIAPHLGGGAGRFLANITESDSQNKHEFCLLEPPVDTHLLTHITWQLFENVRSRFSQFSAEFDIIQIEFWNHPLLFKFLFEHSLPSCRLIVYSHVSGIYPPNIIPQVMFRFADVVVLSTPAAKHSFSDHIKNGKCRIIHEIGGVNRTNNLERVDHSGINITYIGTASYAKLHPGYIQACRTILKHVPEVRFEVASNDNNSHLSAECEELGISECFNFYYRTNDIGSILSRSDLFGYPLRPDHFGTGEQAILEAMGAGIPPVVIGNPAESSLIQDGKTGVIANDIYDYVEAIKYCVTHPSFMNHIGRQAKTYASKNFSISHSISHFDSLYQYAMTKPKALRYFRDFIELDENSPGWSLFKLCLGNHKDICNFENSNNNMLRNYFKNKLMRSPHLMNQNKGGLVMYQRYFPNDPLLNSFLSLSE